MMPPKDVEPSALFLKLLEPLPSEVVDFPRKGADGKPIDQIRIAVLPHEAHNKARIAAHETLRGKNYTAEDLKSGTLAEVLGDETAKELLAMACFQVNSQFDDDNGNPIYGRIFTDARSLDVLQADEVAVLFNTYLLIQHKYGPLVTDPDVDHWVKLLKEGGREFPLSSMALPDLAELTFSCAERVYSLYLLLHSHRESLPSSLAADLEGFLPDTTWFSEQPENSAPKSGEKSADTAAGVDLTRQTRAIDSLQEDVRREET